MNQAGCDRRNGAAYALDDGLNDRLPLLRRTQKMDRQGTQRTMRIPDGEIGRFRENGCDITTIRPTDDPPPRVDPDVVSAIADTRECCIPVESVCH